MWKPPQRIKYKPAPGVWPSRGQALASCLFSPINIGGLKLMQRTWIPAMVPWRASEQGFVTDDILDLYERYARGRPGGLVVEATGIRDIPSGPLLRIGHDRFLPGLYELVDTVRRASAGQTRLFIQLIDFLTIRRRPTRDKYVNRYLHITAQHRQSLGASDSSDADVRKRLLCLRDDELGEVLSPRELQALQSGYRERITDTHLPHIKQLPEVLPDLFAKAAQRAQDAGFDGVELHYAHAYTMASFLSARNTRNDGYGGGREQRLRLPLEVFRRVREVLGEKYPIGCRFLSEECIEGGSSLADSEYFGLEFARAGMDFLSLSRGGKFEDAKQPAIGWAAYPYTGPSGYECMPQYISDEQGPFGRNVAPTASIRRKIRQAGLTTPVIVSGGIHGFRQAEDILQREDADIIGAARQSLADPDWFRKVHLGRGGEVRTCEYTNYCEGLDQKHKQVTCQLWDRIGLDKPGVKRTLDGKRRLTPPDWTE